MAKKKQKSLIDEYLLSIKDVPAHLIQAEKVTERLLNKKLTPKQRTSVKFARAIDNYRTAVTRAKRANTLLEKHFKTLNRLVNKFVNDETDNTTPDQDQQSKD